MLDLTVHDIEQQQSKETHFGNIIPGVSEVHISTFSNGNLRVDKQIRIGLALIDIMH
jgi:hypothetical protein